MKLSLMLFGLMFAANAAGYAQQDPTLATGLLPYGTFQGGDIDSVNVYNGALNIRIPLIEYPQVGGKLKLGFSYVWTGKSIAYNEYCTADFYGDNQSCWDGWQETPYNSPYNSNLSLGTGPSYGIVDDQDVGFESYEYIYSPQGEGFTWYFQLGNFITSDGAVHPAVDVFSQPTSLSGQRSVDGTNLFNGNRQAVDFLPTGPGYPVAPTCTQQCYTVDAEGISYAPSPGVLRQDANGNKITFDSQGYVDTTGRIFPLSSSTTSDSSGCTGPLPVTSVSVVTFPGISGGSLPYKFCYAQVSIAVLQSPVTDLQSIVLPNGEAWTFEYNVAPDGEAPGYNFGELSKITYPTGGTISYTYRYYVNPMISASISLAVSSRTVNDNNGGGNQVWTYGGTSLPSALTGSYAYDVPIVSTDPLGNETVHVFDPWLGIEVYTQYYDHFDRQIHKTVAKNYDALYISGNAGALGYLNAFPTSIVTTLDNGKSSTETRSYGGMLGPMCDYIIEGGPAEESFLGLSVTNGSYQYSSQGACGASFGKLKEKVVHDYVTSGTGSVLSDTVNQYQFQTSNGSGYITANLLDPIASTTVSDTAQRAQTTYGYDETGLGPSGARGNQTSVSQWLNTTGGTIKSTTAYDNNGMPTLVTDANLNQTSISYQCGDSALSSVTRAFGSTMTLPETTTYGYDCPSGKLTSATDPNSVTTTYSYADPLNRLTQISRAVGTPAESWTVFSYPTANQVVAKQDQNAKGDGLLMSSTTVDGLARVIHKSSPDGSVVDTTYDADGHVQSVSNPHFSAGSSTDGVTSYAYDALNRKILQCQPDNGASVPCVAGSSYLQWTYSGNVTTSYDEVRNSWSRTYDALGRLTNITEPTTAQTSYTYDALGNMWSASQSGVSGESLRFRYFTYDSLSRLLTSSNPETGVVCYGPGFNSQGMCYGGYDGDGNLIYKTDARGITTHYSYDALNRLLAKTYGQPNDTANTPSSCYLYDTATYGIGRLGTSWTQPGTCPQAFSQVSSITSRIVASYDPMGRVAKETQCTSANCTSINPPYSLAYKYDLAGHNIYSEDGIGQASWFDQYDTSGRLSGTSAVTVWPGSFYPAQLFSAQTYLPGSILTNWLVGIPSAGSAALTGSRSYDSRLRVLSESETGHE